MSDQKPSTSEAPSVMGVIDRLLAFMTSPWKAGAVVILLIVCGVLYFAYLERARIADAILTGAGAHAQLNEGRFAEDAQRLLRDTRADMVMLVELHLSDNLMTDRIGIDPDGNRWVPSTSPQPALLPESSMALLVRFLANEVVCADTAQAVNEDARALAAKGFVRDCMVAVPPILGVGVGGVLAAWKHAPTPAAEQRAGVALRTAAMKFATW
jgi:hypothetical protein